MWAALTLTATTATAAPPAERPPVPAEPAIELRLDGDSYSYTYDLTTVFDDSIEHEAWNRNLERLRVVLIFDVWRPELSKLEQDLIADILGAVDAYGSN